MESNHITTNPAVMGGVPCIRGLRIPVATVAMMAADGMTSDEIIADLPDLALHDIEAALRHAGETGS